MEIEQQVPEQVPENSENYQDLNDSNFIFKEPFPINITPNIPETYSQTNVNHDIELFYDFIEPSKVCSAMVLTFDIGFHGIAALKKTYNINVIKQLLISTRNKIDKTHKLPPEKWLKSRIHKKLPPYNKKPFYKLFNYLKHFTLSYHYWTVSKKTRIPERSVEQQRKGIYEDVKTYSKFWN